jgi:hypothetical protein
MDPDIIHMKNKRNTSLKVHSRGDINSSNKPSSNYSNISDRHVSKHHDKHDKSPLKSHDKLPLKSHDKLPLKSHRSIKQQGDYPDGYVEDWSYSTKLSTFNGHKNMDKVKNNEEFFKHKGDTEKVRNKTRVEHKDEVDKNQCNVKRKGSKYEINKYKSKSEDSDSHQYTKKDNVGSKINNKNIHASNSGTDMPSLDHVDDNVKHGVVVTNFSPVSIILRTGDNMILNKTNSHNISFTNGILEGSGISINEGGNIITFQTEGSYRFEICGEASLYSDVDVKLIYFSENFPEDIKSFSETKIPRNEGKLYLRGIPTILPLQKNQTIVVKLITTPEESIVLLAGTRLLIHRVA